MDEGRPWVRRDLRRPPRPPPLSKLCSDSLPVSPLSDTGPKFPFATGANLLTHSSRTHLGAQEMVTGFNLDLVLLQDLTGLPRRHHPSLPLPHLVLLQGLHEHSLGSCTSPH